MRSLINHLHRISANYRSINQPVILFFAFLLGIQGYSYSMNSTNMDTNLYDSNGAIAYAYPIKNITIDGDASDWPKNITKFPIQDVPFGSHPKDKNDFSAHFQVGYNLSEQSLYVLVTVIDDSHIVDTTEKADWNTQDTYNLYIDGQHSPKGSGLDLYQFGENYKEMMDPTTSWDPKTKNHSWDQLKIKFSRKGTTTIYECKIKLTGQLAEGKTIGIDHVIIDKDEEDDSNSNTFISWGKGGGKSQSSSRLGDILLMRAKEVTGNLSGELTWDDKTIKGFPNNIRLTSATNPSLWTQVAVDSLGRYEIDLPAGDYIISTTQKFYNQDDNLFRIDSKKSNQKVTITSGNTITAPTMLLSIAPEFDLIPKKGILHDFDAKKIVSVDQFIKAYQEYYEIPGVSLALIKDGKLAYHQTYGIKNAYTEEKVDDTTLFEAASITKPVFGFAVMRLVERGEIDLDKPLYQYLPFEAIAHDERYKLITARHVLTHKTGFPNWAWMNDDGKLDIKFTPGTDYNYSGEGFEYLKRVVAHIIKKDINVLLQEEVLTPLGLEHTYFEKNEYLEKVVANGHFDNMPTRIDLPGKAGMAWSMHTEAKTFTNFILGLSTKKGLKPETYKQMFTIETTIAEDEGKNRPGWEEYFGLSIHMEKTPFGNTFGHGGNNGDFKCLARMYQDLNMGFVVFTNSNRGDQLYNALIEFLIAGKMKKS
ncbi:serine hydrolase [uncultured Aquimarina sp.]|uniref:serine hydrolase n=1 Tax=uncultured Aquimarina sp. TaxID=575652 RepID=UPI0026057CB9|nr:serine hydrolase [uncultured Aquimarina sp.]